MVKVAFICVHNSCRSQMAEAIAKKLYPNGFTWYSAGTEVKNAVNKQAIETVGRLYGVDMSCQHPKLISDIPPVDIVVTMGCNVSCPNLPCKHREDWGLDDPTGCDDDVFTEVALRIEENLNRLVGFITKNFGQ